MKLYLWGWGENINKNFSYNYILRGNAGDIGTIKFKF